MSPVSGSVSSCANRRSSSGSLLNSKPARTQAMSWQSFREDLHLVQTAPPSPRHSLTHFPSTIYGWTVTLTLIRRPLLVEIWKFLDSVWLVSASMKVWCSHWMVSRFSGMATRAHGRIPKQPFLFGLLNTSTPLADSIFRRHATTDSRFPWCILFRLACSTMSWSPELSKPVETYATKDSSPDEAILDSTAGMRAVLSRVFCQKGSTWI